MKNTIKLFFLFISLLISAQNIENLSKVKIPEKFSDFESNQYQMNQFLSYLLKQKGFQVLSEKDLSSSDDLYNPCEFIFPDIKDNSSWFKIKIKVDFKDCRGKLISSYDGKTTIKELRRGYLDALKDASKKITKYTPISNKNISSQKTKKEEIVENLYSDGFWKYRLSKKDSFFTLSTTQNNIVFASLYPTEKSNVFLAKLSNGDTATAYFFTDKITIENYDDKGNKKELILNLLP